MEKETVLVVDDSTMTQMLLKEFLAPHYRVEFTGDGASAIEAARGIVPDLILLDIRLPRMNGIEACRVLKGDPATAEIPIIFITSMDSEQERVEGFEAGAEDYVVKPFYLNELLARVRVHLASRRARLQAVEIERLSLFRELAVAVNHEINNPLTTLYAFLHIIEREVPSQSEILRDSLRGMREELGKISAMTERLATASKPVTTRYSRDIPMIDFGSI